VVISRPPFIRPAAPKPATALPLINIVEVIAVPHIKDPSSKTARKVMKVYLSMGKLEGHSLKLGEAC